MAVPAFFSALSLRRPFYGIEAPLGAVSTFSPNPSLWFSAKHNAESRLEHLTL
jgi:hypothetical protein